MRTSRVVHFAFALVLLATMQLPCMASDITITQEVVGQAPALVGYNCGHLMPDSNTASWWRYSGVNAVRIWCSPRTFEGEDDNEVWGDGVKSRETFLERRIALRADPLNEDFINWQHLNHNFQNNQTRGNLIRLKYAFDFFRDAGITPLTVIHRPQEQYPWRESTIPSGWADRWEHWQHFYAQAFYLSRFYDVERFHMYNEPDLPWQDISQESYLERLQLASDAVQSAIQDVNRLFDKNLVAQMQAPVSSGGTSDFLSNAGDDPRDDVTGWGELISNNRTTSFLGQDSSFRLFHTYAYQQYNIPGPEYAKELASLRSLVEEHGGGTDVSFSITEFNPHSAKPWSLIPETLDSPAKVARFGSILANLMNSEPDELYVFKFSQTANWDRGKTPDAVKKNGVHFVDNKDAPYNIGGVTRGGEVVRLFARGFSGSVDLLTLKCHSQVNNDIHTCASFHREKLEYYFFSANESDWPADLVIDLSELGVAAGNPVLIEEVSSARHGEVRQVKDVTTSQTISLTQPKHSVILVTIPVVAPAYRNKLIAADDAMVKAGVNVSRNYGHSQNLLAKNEPDNPNARNASFIKFDLGDLEPGGVKQAILRVCGRNIGSGTQAIAHVYGINDDDWDEATINWRDSPNLSLCAGAVGDISHNFVTGVGTSASIVGHLTGEREDSEMLLNVTKFVRTHPDNQVTFLIVREVRFDGEDVDDDKTALQLASKEGDNNTEPQLWLIGESK